MQDFSFDLSKLRGRIKEVLGSETEYQKRMAFSTTKRDQRLNGKTFFKQDEILKTCDLLEIAPDEIPTYFFKVKVRNYEQ